jgi:nickel/cobalt exporter
VNDLPAIEQRLITVFDAPEVWWLAVLIALGVGAAHAVAPGHGKAITAAYLAGSRARYRHAFGLAAIVAAMHTVSVLALALAWVGISAFAAVGTDTVTAWLQLLAGAVVISVGGYMLVRSARHRRAHRHDHESGRDHHHGHSHAVPAGGRPGLVALGLSGGLMPSPSAFFVLVTGLLTGRTLGAIALVVAFGVGMAFTLTLVGAATIWGRATLEAGSSRFGALQRLAAWMPTVAGVAVVGGGGLYVARAAAVLAA